MKFHKTLAITIAGALLVGGVGAQNKSATSTAVPTSTTTTVYVRPFCKFGLQFLASSLSKTDTGNGSGGLSVTQVMADTGKPMACKEDVK